MNKALAKYRKVRTGEEAKKYNEQLLQNQTNAYKLFNRRFKIEVPTAFIYTDEDFARGIRLSDSREDDVRTANELVSIFLPIVREDDDPNPSILSLFELEVPDLRVCQLEDLKNIYDIITTHFGEMAEYMSRTVNLSEDRRARIVDDLTRLDKLAAFLHTPVHTAIPQHLAPDSIESKIKMFLKRPIVHEDTEPTVVGKPEVPTYEGYQPTLNPRRFKKAKRWGK